MSGSLRRWRTNRPVDVVRTVGPLRHGGGDPTWRFIGGVFFRAALTIIAERYPERVSDAVRRVAEGDDFQAVSRLLDLPDAATTR